MKAMSTGALGLCSVICGCAGERSATGAGFLDGWARRLGSEANVTVTGLDVAADGTIVVAGEFWHAVNIGGTEHTTEGGGDVFVVAYARTGELAWSTTFGTSQQDEDPRLAAADDRVYLLTAEFDSTVRALSLTDGGTLWEKRVTETWTLTSDPGAIAVSRDGDALFLGNLDDVYTNTYGRDGMLLKELSADDGETDWEARFEHMVGFQLRALTTDSAGNIYTAGTFVETVDLGSGSLVSAGVTDVFLASFDSTGAPRWSLRLGGAQGDDVHSLAVDDSGHLFVAGRHYSQPLTIAGTELRVHDRGDSAMYFARLAAADGTIDWVRGVAGGVDTFPWDLTLDRQGRVVIAGRFYGTTDFGGIEATEQSVGDCFIATYSADDGTLAQLFTHPEDFSRIAFDGDQTVVAGSFHGSFDIVWPELRSDGLTDGFVARGTLDDVN
jgi:outer membrane protein assembly factor BamB